MVTRPENTGSPIARANRGTINSSFRECGYFQSRTLGWVKGFLGSSVATPTSLIRDASGPKQSSPRTWNPPRKLPNTATRTLATEPCEDSTVAVGSHVPRSGWSEGALMNREGRVGWSVDWVKTPNICRAMSLM